MPAMCGVGHRGAGLEVVSRPLWLAGETAATTSTPGRHDVRLQQVATAGMDGPRLENAATTGASTGRRLAGGHERRGRVAARRAMYGLDRLAVRGVDVHRRYRVEVRVQLEFGDGLYRIMPTPPACWTALLLSTRALVPRLQTTILPATLAGSSDARAAELGVRVGSPVDGRRSPSRSAAPTGTAGADPDAGVGRAVAQRDRAVRTRSKVPAATVVSHGIALSTVLGARVRRCRRPRRRTRPRGGVQERQLDRRRRCRRCRRSRS